MTRKRDAKHPEDTHPTVAAPARAALGDRAE